MTTMQAIICRYVAAIRASSDDTPALICADELTEAGFADRAELILVQCALSRLQNHPAGGNCPVCRDIATMKARESALFLTARLRGWHRPLGEDARWTYRRGFVDEVELPILSWDAISDELMEAQPIRALRPSMRVPANVTHGVIAPLDGALVRLWQSPHVGKLAELDLSLLVTDDRSSWHVRSCARHAFRPWQGLRRLRLPVPTWLTETGQREDAWVRRWRGYLGPATQVVVGQ